MRGGKLVIAVGDGLTAIINRCLVSAILAARHSIGSNVRWSLRTKRGSTRLGSLGDDDLA